MHGMPSAFKHHTRRRETVKRQHVLGLCYAGMACVALGANLQPVYLTTYA